MSRVTLPESVSTPAATLRLPVLVIEPSSVTVPASFLVMAKPAVSAVVPVPPPAMLLVASNVRFPAPAKLVAAEINDFNDVMALADEAGSL